MKMRWEILTFFFSTFFHTQDAENPYCSSMYIFHNPFLLLPSTVSECRSHHTSFKKQSGNELSKKNDFIFFIS